MKETIFKVGDKVFDYQFGWGMVMRAGCENTKMSTYSDNNN